MGSHTLPDSITSPFRFQWVKHAGVFNCNLPPALSAEWPSTPATAATQEVDQIPKITGFLTLYTPKFTNF